MFAPVLSHCRQKQNRGRQRGYIPLFCPSAGCLNGWLAVDVHRPILDQSADREDFPTADLEPAGKQRIFFFSFLQIFKHLQMSKYPFSRL